MNWLRGTQEKAKIQTLHNLLFTGQLLAYILYFLWLSLQSTSLREAKVFLPSKCLPFAKCYGLTSNFYQLLGRKKRSQKLVHFHLFWRQLGSPAVIIQIYTNWGWKAGLKKCGIKFLLFSYTVGWHILDLSLFLISMISQATVSFEEPPFHTHTACSNRHK